MVHDKVSGVPKKSPVRTSPIRSSSRRTATRYRPTPRETSPATTKRTLPNNLNQALWSTIYTLNLPQQAVAQLGDSDSILSNHTRPAGASHHFDVVGESDHQASGKAGGSSVKPRNEKSVLDKVEDMDIDHQSDHEGHCFVSADQGTSSKASLETDPPTTMGRTAETIKQDKKTKQGCEGLKQKSSKGKKNTSEIGHGSKVVKKKPIYIILHAALVRVGGITGKALSPVRIQAERILIQIEVKTDSASESLTLRVPCKELAAVQTNLSEPPYMLVAIINHDYTQHIMNGGKKSGVLDKLKGVDELEMVIQLTYDSMPKDVKQDLEMLRKDLSKDVKWKEISSSQARDILSGKAATDSNDSPNEKESTSGKERKILKTRGNRKENFNHKIENTAQEETTEVSRLSSDEADSSVSPKNPITVKRENTDDASDTSLGKSVKVRRKRTYDETTPDEPPSDTDTDSKVAEEKAGKEAEKDETVEKKHQSSEVVSLEKSSVKVNGFRYVPLPERSSEETRPEARRLAELEAVVTEKEGLLRQRRISVELRELQLEQERNTVKELRASLREEQSTKRELAARFEAVSGELVARNSRDISAESRVQEMEQELSHLNISLTDIRSENQRLVQEIHEVRGRMVESEQAVNSERNTMAALQEDLETTRRSLERLREEIRRKDDEIKQEQDLRAEVVERNDQLRRTLVTTTEDYERRLRTSDEERTRLDRQYEECNEILVATREQVHGANTALRRAQETIDEYSRMQPRDWTISRDEIAISETVLGQGAWGWVKEGTFRGTKVAVKQMHELIVSPHNRRLFEREMQMAARCRHPNLLQFIGATNDNGLALLVTELLDSNLRSVLGQRSLCQDEVLTLALGVTRALNYLHLNKPFPIVHRDISSTNVLLWKREDAWHAKLSDYGAANFMRQCMTVSPGASIYAAPEAMTSRQSTKVDVYSFGLLLCEMCIRELPVPGHTNDQIRLITNAHLRDLVQRCTNEIPDNRPTTHDVLSALQHLWSSSGLGTVSINSRQVVL